MDKLLYVLSSVGQSYPRIFFTGILGGMGLELFKIHFQAGGINYYKVFRRNNLQRELEGYEEDLIETEKTLIKFAKSKGIDVPDDE
ncbi:unnamed protein product [Bursaphelenchus okinawaensis]|uniref:Uncharacterized protein n=1 Tax=Bursaphelenchus okinawaensis TaxID=465554 RepID=A0A811KPP8_9BILA|nr:unnamed protein product [Bursaphelenchus okinawaensis]CAG9106999.1 unnamed protein product [Bursaphelenchus okinawaensis]